MFQSVLEETLRSSVGLSLAVRPAFPLTSPVPVMDELEGDEKSHYQKGHQLRNKLEDFFLM